MTTMELRMNRIAGLVGVPVVAFVMIACSSTTE